MNADDDLYSFVWRGLLTEEALDEAGRLNRYSEFENIAELERLVSMHSFDDEYIERAREMSVVYIAIASFEMSVRDLVVKVLVDANGEGWWEQCVSVKIREAANARMEEEEKVRWHTPRGQNPINFTMLPNLLNIIRQNIPHFEPFIHNVEWAAQIFDAIERSRNVIMHSGILNKRDVARVGSLISDWTRQVSA